MWPELPALCDEIVAEIRTVVPIYEQAMETDYADGIRLAVQQIVAAYVRGIALPASSTRTRDETCRELGRLNAEFGISFDHLQEAYRLGVRVGWRHVVTVAKRGSVPATVISALADSLFGYIGELVSLSREGYLEVLNASPERLESRGRHLLRAIVAGPSVPPETVSRLAQTLRWPLPEQVTAVAITPGTLPDSSRLDSDVLVDVLDNEPHLLVPGPLDEPRRDMLGSALVDCDAAVGLTTPLADARNSLRCARHGLRLVTSGVASGNIIDCRDHLLTMWLLAEPVWVDYIAADQLAPLERFARDRRERMIKTLRAWLACAGNAGQMADQLSIHPQTVRYRIRTLKQVFGASLDDPEWRMATDLALRVLALREQVRQ
jgi:hypothetical protein